MFSPMKFRKDCANAVVNPRALANAMATALAHSKLAVAVARPAVEGLVALSKEWALNPTDRCTLERALARPQHGSTSYVVRGVYVNERR